MAILAIGMIKDFDVDGSGGIRVHLKVRTPDDAHYENDLATDYFSISGLSGLTFTSDVKTFLKNWTATQWSLSYGLLDEVRLVQSLDLT